MQSQEVDYVRIKQLQESEKIIQDGLCNFNDFSAALRKRAWPIGWGEIDLKDYLDE